jgi:type II secretory pathway component PulK
MATLNKSLKTRSKEKGFALILVLSLTTAIMTIVAELLFQTEIISRSNLSIENKQRAETTALNGLELAQYLLKMQIFLDSALEQLAGNVPMEGMLDSFLGGQKLYQLLNHIPIGSEAIENLGAMPGVDILRVLDPTLLEFFQTVDGYFIIDAKDISGKFNVNHATIPSKRASVVQALTRIFSLPNESSFLMNLSLSAREMAENIADYVDTDNVVGAATSGGPDESTIYRNFEGRKTRNAPLQSIEELRRIPPFEQDEVFDVFSPYLTVFPYPVSPTTNDTPLMNINEMDIVTLTALSTPEGKTSFEEELDKIEEEPPKFKEARDLASTFQKIREDEGTRTIHSELIGFESHTYEVKITSYVGNITRSLLAIYTKNKDNKAEPIRLEYIEYN